MSELRICLGFWFFVWFFFLFLPKGLNFAKSETVKTRLFFCAVLTAQCRQESSLRGWSSVTPLPEQARLKCSSCYGLLSCSSIMESSDLSASHHQIFDLIA